MQFTFNERTRLLNNEYLVDLLIKEQITDNESTIY